jgi:subtilisin family serine protease
MPLRTTGVEPFLQHHPSYDGRGVVIAVLDGGVDPGVPGMRVTSTGERKLLDLRDFSGEGRIALDVVVPSGPDTIRVGGRPLRGFGRVARLSTGPYYAGVFRETLLGTGPSADVNGDGDETDEFPVLVARASDGWFLVTDTNGDQSFEDERPLHDYSRGAEIFTYGAGPMALAANLTDSAGRPVLDFYFDNSSHGTHVAGIAAGHDLFGVEGFDGVAPGAQVLALKIANNSWGKISVSGSMMWAMSYAADYAARRNLPLVLNLSYGVGNEDEGSAAIDSLLNGFAERHPDVPVVVSAGNDGPGLSTVGFPASADLALSVCALVPGVFARPPEPGVPSSADLLGWWSARGGEVAKPDLCAPGIAFSNVPPWKIGDEIAGGTSQAAPQVAGAAALLQSAMAQERRRVRAVDLKRALMATANRLPGATPLDQGAGVPDVAAAYDWLVAAHQAGIYLVRAGHDGGNTSLASAAYRRNGLASPADTLQRFLISSVGGQAAARLLLKSDADWLRTPPRLEMSGQPAEVTLTYDRAKLAAPGVYVGSVWARPATDTLSGAAFRLTNTVVVPHDLRSPLSEARSLAAGSVDRYFLAVPAEAGGLKVSLRVTAGRGAILYLFEPSGQPYRAGGTIEATGDTVGSLSVAGEDLMPGVYEAAVVAPPAAGVTYRFSAALPAVAVRAIGTGPSAVLVNRTPDTCVVSVRARITGAVREYSVSGTDEPARLVLAPPSWAARLVVDISLPREAWNRMTDFGLRIRGASGREMNERPLDYAFGRRSITLDSIARGGPITLAFLPAFARSGDTGWRATVRVAFIRDHPRPLPVLGMGEAGQLTLKPNETLALQFSPLPTDPDLPAGYAPLVDIVAQPRSGPASTRQAPVSTAAPP